MTRRDDTDRDDDRDVPDDADRPSGVIRSLLAILQEMEERGERRRSGHSRPDPHTSIDYSIRIGGLSEPDDEPADTGGRGPDDREPRSGEGSPDAHVTTRETDDGLVVVADLPGVDEEAVDTRLDHDAGEVVIEVAGRDAARLPLQSDEWTVVDSRYANGVLEVELRRD